MATAIVELSRLLLALFRTTGKGNMVNEKQINPAALKQDLATFRGCNPDQVSWLNCAGLDLGVSSRIF